MTSCMSANQWQVAHASITDIFLTCSNSIKHHRRLAQHHCQHIKSFFYHCYNPWIWPNAHLTAQSTSKR
jgi:hypothetical protein